MPYKIGKMKGELTTPEIRKLIKAHNVLVSIKIPTGSKREDIMKILKKKGYMVDHEKGQLRPVTKGKVKKLPVVGKGTVQSVLPKPKTATEKADAKKVRDKKKEQKETQAFKKRDAQVKALGKLITRKKKGQMGKVDPNKIPVFDDYKKLEKYFMSQLTKYKKEVNKFLNKIPQLTDIKELKKQKQDLRNLGNNTVLEILVVNEDLFSELGDAGDEKFENLDSRVETYMTNLTKKIQERIEQLEQ